jgi:hypothetical protein
MTLSQHITPQAVTALKRKRLSRIFVLVGVGLLSVAMGLGVFGVSKREASAQFAVEVILDIPRIEQFFETEIQEIAKDQIRKTIMEQVTKKMIEKIIGGQNGGIGGGSGGSSGNGQGALIVDMGQFLYEEADEDTQRYIDQEYDRQFPSYIDPSIKDQIKITFDSQAQVTPDDCIDIDQIDGSSEDATQRLQRYIQPGCNDLSAQVILSQHALQFNVAVSEASKIEAIANAGLVKKDEQTNQIKQSGQVYDAIIASLLQGVVDVQTNNESAVSSIIGALVDQLLDELLGQEF